MDPQDTSGNLTDEKELLPKETEFDEEKAEDIVLESSTPLPVAITTKIKTNTGENIEATITPQIHDELNTHQESFTPVEGLKIGQWVEFVGEGKEHRLNCKLAHIDKSTNRYIFENRSGMKVAECDGKQLFDQIESGSIIIQNDVQIF